MKLEDYMKGKKFFTYGESSEVFVAENKEQLYKTYFNEKEDDLEDHPSEEITIEMDSLMLSEEKLSEEDVRNLEGLWETRVKSVLKIAAEDDWDTPWQLSSSYI